MRLSSRRFASSALTAAEFTVTNRVAKGFVVPIGLDEGRQYTLALQPGTLLDGAYRIAQVLTHSSTYAVTYLAHDERAGEQVVVKEFFPRMLAARAADGSTLRPYSPDDASTLGRAVRRFLREADLLVEIRHPNIPRARGSFEANGTAYLVLQYYPGRTLTEHVAAAGDPLPADLASGLVLQVLHGLGALHSEGIVHGYLTPDNILVDANWRALVLGLGTTRHVVGPKREPVAGYAPIEQYAAKEVGPWTDVYACAAMLYRLTTGQVPPSAVERSAGESLVPPLGSVVTLPSSLVKAVIAGLAQLPDARPHSAEEFRRRLDASLALDAQRGPSRDEERGKRPVWPQPTAASPEPAVDAVVTAEPSREVRQQHPDDRQQDDHHQREDGRPQAYDDDLILLTPEDGPRDSVRRILRLVFGIGGAAAMILVAVSAFTGRKQHAEASDETAAAPPRLSITARTPPQTDIALRQRSDWVSRPADDDVVPQPIVKARVQPVTEAAPRPSTTPSVMQAAVEPTRPELRRETVTRPAPQPTARNTRRTDPPTKPERPSSSAAVSAPAVKLSLPAALGQVEVMPAEVVAGLRERLRHGNENLEFGAYAEARRIYGGALERVATLNAQYGGTGALQSVKQDLERAAERALAACVAQNEVIRKRNGKAVPCE